jgi:hypothetical protein
VPAITIREATVEPGGIANDFSKAESEGSVKTKPTNDPNTQELQIDRILRSAMLALKRVIDGLTKAKDQKKMISRMSARSMERFKEVGFSAGQQVEVKCPGLRKSTLVDFGCTTNSRDLNQADLESLLKDFQSVGRAGFKRAWKLLGTKRFQSTFVEGATVALWCPKNGKMIFWFFLYSDSKIQLQPLNYQQFGLQNQNPQPK